MSREEITNRLLALRSLRLAVAAEEKRVQAEAEALFTKVGQREVGELAGHDLGSVQLIKGTSTWTVADPEAWLRWVQKHRPEEIVFAVRESFTKATLAKLARDESLVDDEGECYVPDGLIPRRGEPTLRVSVAKDAAQTVLDTLGDVAIVLGLAERAEILWDAAAKVGAEQ